MNLIIRPIKKEDYKRAHAFQVEYLDQESFEEFISRVIANPDLYLTAFNGEELIGVCYGHPSSKGPSVINLQGIAVSLDEIKGYARRGIGSKLMESFEEAVKRRGYHKIDVGAADDLKVESFYLKNAFKAYELVAKDFNYEECERVKINDYESGKIIQQELRQKHNPREVIFIFEKSI